MTDILSFKPKRGRAVRVTPEDVVQQVVAAGATELICIGANAETGDTFSAVTKMPIAEALYMLEQFKQALMAGELAE